MQKGKKTVYFVTTKDGKNKNRRLDAEQSCLPLRPKEKHLNYYAMVAIMTAGAIASWAFVTGTAIGVLVPVKYGMFAALFGCLVAFCIHAYNAVTFSRWGTEMSVIGRATWGHRGIYFIILGVGFPATYGWGSMPMIMLGRGISSILGEFGLKGSFISHWQIWSLLFLVIGLLITYYGTTVIDKISAVATPIIVCLIVFICVVLVRDYGLSASFNTMPQGVSPDRATLVRNYMIATEIALGVGFSWLYLLSAYTKPSLSENAAYTPSCLGSGVAWAICAVAPMLTAALSGYSDPIAALVQIGGTYAVLWMIMLALANFSSVMVNPYFLSCSLTAMFPQIKWKTAVLIQSIYVVAIIFPVFYDRFGQVISFIGMVEAPAGMIWVLDVFLKKKMNLRHCYGTVEQKKKSAYWYFHGFNPAPWIGLVCGSAFGLWLYNPYTAEIAWEGFFDLFGAMFPAAILGTAVYYLIFRFIQVPRGIGIVEMRETIDEYADKNQKLV